MILLVKAQIGETGPVVTLRGRDTWALLELKLRKVRVVIETIREAHADPFSGEHARYVLRSLVTILERNGGSS
jgi:hypothetical protein